MNDREMIERCHYLLDKINVGPGTLEKRVAELIKKHAALQENISLPNGKVSKK